MQDLSVDAGTFPDLPGLAPLASLDWPLLSILAHLTAAAPGEIGARELVPQLGQISTLDLGDRMPAEVDPRELLSAVGLGTTTVLDEYVVMAISDTYDRWQTKKPATPGLRLRRGPRVCYLFTGAVRQWPEDLPRHLGPGTFPDLMIAPNAGWAVGIDHGTASTIAIARWSAASNFD